MSLIDTALDAQLEQVHLFAGSNGAGVYTWLTEPRGTSTGHKVEAIDEDGRSWPLADNPEAARFGADTVTETLGTAPTYVLTADMGRLVRVATDQLTDQGICPIPTPELLPTPTGFLYMEHPFHLTQFGPDPDQKDGLRGMFWYPTRAGYFEETGERKFSPGVGMIAFRAVHPNNAGLGLTVVEPVDLTAWTYDLAWREAESHDAFMAELLDDGTPRGGFAHPAGAEWRRFIYSVWHLCTERISPRKASRSARRRWLRIPTEPNFGDVRVIDLRRYAMRAGEQVGSEDPDYARQWSHRWVVSGHWHTYWAGPGKTEKIVKWLDPYVKGPSDKPLILRDDVFLVRR
jgi:hypothetical protein